MITKNILYGGLLALTVSCNDGNSEQEQRLNGALEEIKNQEEREKSALRDLCGARYILAVQITILDPEVREVLDSQEWCKNKDRYQSEADELKIIVDEHAIASCKQLRIEVYQSIPVFTEKDLNTKFPCQGEFNDIFAQALELNRFLSVRTY